MDVSQKIWIPDTKESWVLGNIISINEDKVIIKNDDVEKEYLLDNCLLCNNKCNQDNLIRLTHLHEASILNSLYTRYSDNNIYTFTGDILIAVNPFKKLDLYNVKTITSFSNGDKSPHPYFICQNAYKSILTTKQNQSILVSGESGAGKTQTSKIIMEYLSAISKNSEINIEEKILSSNPILEAFGNAKTIRNDNSSRFGKYIKINFNSNGTIIGSKIETYLLEKVRILYQAENERNFHIFYQILEGFSEDMKKKYYLDTTNFKYLSNGTIKRNDDINDQDEFQNLLVAFYILGFSEKEKNDIFSIIVAILYLGNIDFDEDGKITENSQNNLEKISKNLNISSNIIEHNLCNLKISINNEEICKPLNKIQCETSRNSLAKYLYSILFEWIVIKINHEISGGNQGKFIGILDIFGFEVFEQNSFEQLCINFANESLQNQFNNYIFKSEQEEYKKEKISWENIVFPDNIECLKTLSGKGGVFSILDAECLFPKGNDISFNNKLIKNLSNNPYISFQKIRKNQTFIVKHYAGKVCYSSDTFCDKNKNRVSNEINNIIKNIDLQITNNYCNVFKHNLDTKVSSIKSETTSSYFRKQMKNLLSNIKETKPYYIRCIKPNDENIPDNFVKIRVSQQLKYGGVLEAIKVSRAGYPIRFLHKDFYKRYFMLKKNKGTHLDFIKNIVNKMNIENSDFQIGITKLFLKRKSYNKIERKRESILDINSCIIQKNIRLYIQYRKYKKTLNKIIFCQSIIRRKLSILNYVKLIQNIKSITIQKNIRKFLCFKKYKSILNAVKLIQSVFRLYINIKKKKEDQFLKNIVLLQSIFRKKRIISSFNKKKKSIIKIQNLYRCRISRTILKKKKREKKSLVYLQQEHEKLKEEINKKNKEIELLKNNEINLKPNNINNINDLEFKFKESEQANLLLSTKMNKLLMSNQEALEKIKRLESRGFNSKKDKDICIIS